MCGPVVMAAVRAEIHRRRLLGMAGAALAGAAFGAQSVAARQATPVAGGPVALAGFSAMTDLTHVLTPDFPLFPGNGPIEFTVVRTFEEHGYYANRLAFDEHSGTHMDAPAHFDPDGTYAANLDIANFVAPLAVIDVSARAATDPDTQVTPDDILAWEARHGPLPAGAFVAMNSGWDARAGDPAAFRNQDADGVMHFPGFHPDASALLVNERDVVGIGVDTLSLDYGASMDFATHKTVLPAGKFGLEGLANLGTLPAAAATIIVGGPKHLNASGGPSRVYALT